MGKKVRLWVLMILATLTLLVRLTDISQVALRGAHPWMTWGLITEVAGNRLSVKEVSETDVDGRPNPFYLAGLRPGDRIIEIRNSQGEGTRIQGFNDYGDAMRSLRRAHDWSVIVARSSEDRTRQLRLDIKGIESYGLRTWLAFWGLALVFPLITVGTGFFIGFKRPDDDNAFTASLLLLSFSSYFGINHFAFPPGLRLIASVYQTMLVNFLPFLFLRFFLLFPSPSPIERWSPRLKYLCLLVTVVVFGLQLQINHVFSRSFSEAAEMGTLLSIAGPLTRLLPAMFVVGLISLVLNTLASRTLVERRRMRILLLGTVLGLGPLILLVTWVRTLGAFAWELFFIAVAMLILFPLSFAYAVIRHKVMGVHLIIRRGLQYAVVSKGFLAVEWVVLYLAFSFAAAPLISRYFPNASTLATAILASLAVAGIWSLNKKIMPVIDRQFFRQAYDAEQILNELVRSVRTLAADPDRLLRTVVDRISDSLYPDQVAIFLRGVEVRGPARIHEQSPATLRFDPSSESDFQSHWRRLRSPKSRPIGESAASGGLLLDPMTPVLTLGKDSFIPLYLRRFIDRPPEPLEVHLDDPRNWTRKLVASGQDADKRSAEKGLLEELNTRLIVPLLSHDSVLGFISLGEKLSEEPYSGRDKELLMSVAEQASVALDYAYLIEQAAEQESINKDLEIAREVQVNLLPTSPPELGSLEYTGVCRSARVLGGDYYDFLACPDQRLCLALGDISGKGISAALLMASLQALLHSQAGEHGEDVGGMISAINRHMCSSTTSSKFATFFCGLYEDRERRFTYVNAGHNPPLLFRLNPEPGEGQSPNGQESSSTGNAASPCSPTRLRTGGTVLGIFEEAVYEQETVSFSPGDVLLAFSDGVSEARNQADDEFGEDRLEALVRKNLELSSSDLCQLIMDEIQIFVGDAPQHDDMTLLIAKARP